MRECPTCHSEILEANTAAASRKIAGDAQELLLKARQTGDYQDCARALYGFETALEIWKENESALAGRAQAQLVFAETALGKGDLDLGLCNVDSQNPAHADVLAKLRTAQHKREMRRAMLVRMKRAMAAILCVQLFGTLIAVMLINKQKEQAMVATQLARDEATVAKKNEELARQRLAKVLAKEQPKE